MTRALFAYLVLCALGTSAWAEAKITLIVKTRYPSEMKLSRKDGLVKPKLVWRQSVKSSTVLTVTVDPVDVDQYLIQDANAVTTIWMKAEDGDSLVFSLDLDSGTYALSHDKQGFVIRGGRILARHSHYQKRLDSASEVLPLNTFQRHAKRLQSEFQQEISTALDSMRASKRHPILQARAEYLSTGAALKYLQSRWSAATKSSLCGKRLSYTSIVGSSHKDDDVFSDAVSAWFNILSTQAMECGTRTNMDSVERAFVNSFQDRRRGLAYTVYSLRKLTHEKEEQVARDLLAAMPSYITDTTLARRYEEMIAERLSLSPGSIAPEIELPDSNGVLRKLSDFRGKIVLIDFWGTWCKPCIRELPHLESLAGLYESKDLQILGVALEYKQVKPWTNFIARRRLPGLQLYAESQWNNEEVAAYFITSVPRYVLVDRLGKIINSNAPRPSDPKLRGMINNALKD